MAGRLANTALVLSLLVLPGATFPPDAPLRDLAANETGGAKASEVAGPLQTAQRLATELRFEEAIVEYQRYLGSGLRPAKERAQALLELGFLHLLLNDEVSAQVRASEALEIDPDLKTALDAPVKQVKFLERMKQQVGARVRVELIPRRQEDPAELVRARVTDRKGKVKTVLVRHGLAMNGPFYGTAMTCQAGECSAEIPPPKSAGSYTAWYYVEAQDADGTTLGRAKGPTEPVQVSIITKAPWYRSPWIWGGTAAGILAVTAVIYFASIPPK